MVSIIREGKGQDHERIKEFLQKASLETEGVGEDHTSFLLLESNIGELLGTIGLEVYESTGLLRSLVISKELSVDQVYTLFEQTVVLAKKKNVKSLYMVTNRSTVHSFFAGLGFLEIEESLVPDHLNNRELFAYAVKDKDAKVLVKII